MANVNAPSDQTPTMAPLIHADDQILPHIRWIPIGKSNCYLDLEKSQSNPIYKIAVDLLKNTNFFRAFTASSNLPLIYIQQFWDTILYDKKAGCYKCQLDEQWKKRFHSRPNSSLHLSNKEPILGYIKFSAKGTKREIFGMPIPSKLITINIQKAPYYQEYQENVAKHRGFLAGETGSTQDLPAPKPAKPARKPQSTAQKAPLKPSILSSVTSTQPAPTSVPAKTQENKRKQATGTTDKPAQGKRIKQVPDEELQVVDEDADFQKVVEESMKDAYVVPKGPLPLVVIREPESGKYQRLLEVPGKGKAKVSEEQVAHYLLSLQKHKKTSPADQYIFQRRVSKPIASSFHDESSYEVLGQSDSEEESEKIMLRVKKGGQDEGQAGPDPKAQAEGQTGSDSSAQAEGQAGSNPDETSEGQAGSNPDETSEGQAGSNPDETSEGRAGPDPEQLYEGFTAMVYPNVQENLKLAVEEPVFDKPSDVDKSAETKVESMVNVPIQQALSSISLMTSPIIDLTSRPESPKEHQQLKATTTDTTTTTTTMLPPPQAPQQSMTEAMMVKRIDELEHTLADLIQVNKIMEERLDKHGARNNWTSLNSACGNCNSYKSHEDHMQLFEALEKSINRDHSEELAHNLAEARKNRKKAGPSGMSGALRASGSQVTPPLPPPTSTNQDSPSKGSAAPSPAKTATTTEHQAWSTPDVTLKPLVSFTPEGLDMDEAMGPDEKA
nr:hypothetical protein [Tanacetum cinerariifolium]